jgi:hypothetical protein
MWKPEPVVGNESLTVWDRLREYAASQSGPFTSQEAQSWFRRHAPSKANDRTVRTHIRGACWNVGDRSQFSSREPFLTRIDRGLFRRATPDEIEQWRAGSGTATSAGAMQRGRDPSTTVPVPMASAAHGGLLETQRGATMQPPGDWHTEANVQSSLVIALATDGWRILSVANTATKEHGI